MKCTSQELYLNLVITFPEMLPVRGDRSRDRPPDDASLTALLQQLRREATRNGR